MTSSSSKRRLMGSIAYRRGRTGDRLKRPRGDTDVNYKRAVRGETFHHSCRTRNR